MTGYNHAKHLNENLIISYADEKSAGRLITRLIQT